MEVIHERSGPRGVAENVYLLTGPGFQPLAGNLTNWPAAVSEQAGWLEVTLARRDAPSGRPHVIRGRAFALAAGYHLFVEIGRASCRDNVCHDVESSVVAVT